MQSSIVSYPVRGPYGSSKWRGNTSGLPLVDLFKFLKPEFVCDPARGSDTTGDVCREMGIRYAGLDLHAGFNLLKDGLAQRLRDMGHADAPDHVFFHPPYGDMITYSGNVWGEPHPDDLSRCKSPEDFLAKMELAMFNIYDALRPNGTYAIMIADHRSKGEFRSYQADLIGMGIGKLRSVIIKAQHNCWSDRQTYSNRNFIPIQHEYILLWAKDAKILSIGQVALNQHARQHRRTFGTWRNVLTHALRELGGRASRQDVYSWVMKNVDVGSNRFVLDKVRQTLNWHFERVGRDTYSVAA